MACKDGPVVDCYKLLLHHTGEARKIYSPEEVEKFVATDDLFRGTVISALHSKYEDNYIISTTRKDLCGLAFLMLVVSCIL